GNLGADRVDGGQVHGNARLVGDGQQVQHTVGAAAQGHVGGQGVFKGGGGEDIPGAEVLLHQLHHLHARVLCQLGAGGVDRRDGSVAGQRHADGLAQAVHAVGGVHARAAAAAGAGVLGEIVQGGIVDHARLVAAHRLEHLGQAHLP